MFQISNASNYRLIVTCRTRSPCSSTSGSLTSPHHPHHPKVKVSAWRQAKNALATKVNKKRRHVVTGDTCIVCATGLENSFHAAVSCPHAKTTIDGMHSVYQTPKSELICGLGLSWFLSMLDKLKEEEPSSMMLLFWKKWSDRNSLTHGCDSLSAERYVRIYAGIISEFTITKSTIGFI